ncbi:MAG: hypothetical protein JXR73_04225 [Candidatus Omnitrophica bacterium]|nr:hypothetical protein [Candidatus Omnitrophota bacterium]
MNKSETIDIVMPIEDGRHIPQAVLESIIFQNLPFRLWITTQFNQRRISDARNHVKQYAISYRVLMLDNDIILPHNALKKMNQFLDEQPHFAAIALSKNRKFHVDDPVIVESHVDMSCVLFRRNILNKLKFRDTRFEENPCCQCIFMCEDIRALGFEIGFLNHYYARHIQNTNKHLDPANHGECFYD